SLAYRRHFPAIDWLKSYSLYYDDMLKFFDKSVNPNWSKQVQFVNALLQEEAALNEIVRLVGVDALSAEDRLKLLTAQLVREDYLHQNAFDAVDTYASPQKQFLLLSAILEFNKLANKALKDNKAYKDIENLPVRERIGRFKYVEESKVDQEIKG